MATHPLLLGHRHHAAPAARGVVCSRRVPAWRPVDRGRAVLRNLWPRRPLAAVMAVLTVVTGAAAHGATLAATSGPALPAPPVSSVMAPVPAQAPQPQSVGGLPAAVSDALRDSAVDESSLSAVVVGVDGGAPRLAHRELVLRQPASVMKLFTTYAALDLLGPAFVWHTAVGVTGPLSEGELHGSVVLRGRGDPTLVIERLWLLLSQLRASGVHRVTGDFLIDRSAFPDVGGDPANFDGEPLRPYNALPDAFLVNYKSVTLRLSPQPENKEAWVSVTPALQGVQWPERVALSEGACGDWRAGLDLDWSDVHRPRFRGRYPRSCGDLQWPLAWPEAQDYAHRAVAAMWASVGGELRGEVRDGTWPVGLTPRFEFTSPPLAQVVRDINKFSNNLMARQLFLTLGLERGGAGTVEAARALVYAHALEKAGCGRAELVLDNGSGLSRQDLASAACLARLLQSVWVSPWMADLLASLPVPGIDGTALHARGAVARGNVKTGSLRNAAAVAGIVLADSGRRYVVVGLINDERAEQARGVLDALLDWAVHDAPLAPASALPASLSSRGLR